MDHFNMDRYQILKDIKEEQNYFLKLILKDV